MEISISGPGPGVDLGSEIRHDVLVLTEGEPTLAEVLEAAGVAHDPDRVMVDGQATDVSEPFADICRPGSVVHLGGGGAHHGGGTPLGHAVRVVGGLDAGRTHAVGSRSEIVVGRSPQADVVLDDPTVSPFHLRLRRQGSDWFAEDLDSHNGTACDGGPICRHEAVSGRRLQLGATSIVVGEHPSVIAHVSRPGPDGLTPFNRPPRPRSADASNVIAVPDPPADRRRGAAFSFVALLGPLVIGAVMVQVLGSMRYALFALLAPVMMITNAVATRRRNAKDAKSSARRFRRELAAFDASLRSAAAQEAERRDRSLVDLARLGERAVSGSVRLWERRCGHVDHLGLRLGTGPAPWAPPIDAKRAAAHSDLQRLVGEHGHIPSSPLEISLAEGGVVGLVGDRRVALAVARSLVVQATVLHGPADLGLVVATAADRATDWEWAKWLPHTRAGSGRLLAADADATAELLSALADARAADEGVRRPPLILVVDGDELTTARRAPAREFLRGDHGLVAGIVLATSVERLPASCSAVVELADDLGAASLHDLVRGRVIDDVVVDGLAADRAECVARAMAPFGDPDLRELGGDLSVRCSVLDVLELARDPGGRLALDAIRDEWSRRRGADSLSVPLGVGRDGPVLVDLVADGPHALVGGTTGAGKSEFLRSLVAGLAARHGPEDLVFVLIDYKGGAAFDACADLPHVVGLVTDLDGHLAERALRSLEAELHHRERLLRHAGAADLRDYRSRREADELPRLVLVVDEFATLAAELPAFMSSLVGIAQRGRSLGVHMVLATQRPSGAVSADIKANTNIRVALRMQDDRDSTDVIDSPVAASIDRRTPGRAVMRLGPGELLDVQTPLSTSASVPVLSRVSLAPFRFGGTAMVEPRREVSVQTDLEVLVAAAAEAHRQGGGARPRRPWLEMVESVEFCDVVSDPPGDGAIPLAMADDPDRQRHTVTSWNPAEGHLALLGAVGSGRSPGLRTVAIAALATATTPTHVYAVDYSGALGGLERLGACGAVVAGHDHERQRRLLDLLDQQIKERRRVPGSVEERPRVLLLIDDLPAWLADHGDGQDVAEAVRRLLADGPSVGLTVAFTADRAAAVPMRFWGAVSRRFLFRHADPDELTATGLRRHELPEFVAGRAIDSATRLVVQFPAPPPSVEAVVPCRSTWPEPMDVEALPTAVSAAALHAEDLDRDDPCWRLPVGIDASHRGTARLPVRAGDGVLVAGPARSGVSTTLEAIARQVRCRVPETVLVAIAGDRSPLIRAEGLFDATGTLAELERVLEVAALDDERQWFVVMDDAHLHDDPGALEPLLGPGSRCRVVVGGRSDHLHGSFGHWTRVVRRSSTGLLLNPRLDTDGDLLGVRLPRRVPVPLQAGRGFLVTDADAVIVHVAS